MASCCKPEEDDSEDVLLGVVSKDSNIDSTEKKQMTLNGYEEILDSKEENRNKTANKKTFCGYALAFLGVIAISTGMACTQALDKSIPHSELNGFRFLAQFLITAPLLARVRKCDVTIEKGSIGWMIFAAIVLTLSTYMHYGAAYYLPLGVTSSVIRSLGLVMNYIVSCVVNKTVVWYEIVAAILCINGVAMVIQPKFLFHSLDSAILNTTLNDNFRSLCHVISDITYQTPVDLSIHDSSRNSSPAVASYDRNASTNTADNTETEMSKEEIIGYILCVSEAFLYTIYIQLVSRKLSNVNIFVYNFWNGIFGCVSSCCVMGAVEKPVFPFIRACIVFLVVHMLAAGTLNLLLYKAYQLIDPVVSALILTLEIAFTFILLYTLLSSLHPGHANTLEISGAVLIFMGNVLIPAYQGLALKYRKRNGIHKTRE